MHINFKTYRTIKRSLAPVLHTRRNSHHEQHLNTLALLICGIVDAQHVQFDKIAAHVPIRKRKNESLITRFRRWVKHQDLTPEALWLPFGRAVLAGLAQAPLTILLDGTTAGRGCVVLMASVVYRGRALPLLWSVVKGKKGHLPEELHCALIRRLREVIPAQADVMLLGDGEFDGTELHQLRRSREVALLLYKVGQRLARSRLAVSVADLASYCKSLLIVFYRSLDVLRCGVGCT
jgi:hypothetical protein